MKRDDADRLSVKEPEVLAAETRLARRNLSRLWWTLAWLASSAMAVYEAFHAPDLLTTVGWFLAIPVGAGSAFFWHFLGTSVVRRVSDERAEELRRRLLHRDPTAWESQAVRRATASGTAASPPEHSLR